MTIYNVRGAVVELIDAATEADAIAELRRRLAAAGFEPYDDVDTFDAFESEPLSACPGFVRHPGTINLCALCGETTDHPNHTTGEPS